MLTVTFTPKASASTTCFVLYFTILPVFESRLTGGKGAGSIRGFSSCTERWGGSAERIDTAIRIIARGVAAGAALSRAADVGLFSAALNTIASIAC